MKKILLVIILAVLSVSTCLGSGQPKKSTNYLIASKEPKCTLLVVRISYGAFGTTNDTVMTKTMSVSVLLVNNSKDTLRLAYSRCLDPVYFTIDNQNLFLANVDSDCGSQNPNMVIIPPHDYLPKDLMFAYRKETKDTFKFKIAFHLLVWDDKFKTSPAGESAMAQADVIWSDEQTFNADLNYKREETPDKDKKLTKIIYDTLTSDHQKSYILRIDSSRIKKRGSEGCLTHKSICFVVPLRLTNNSNDTLKYIDMTCDWETVFAANNSLIYVPIECSCDKNAPDLYQVAPHRDTTFYLPVYFDVTLKASTRFRLGMVLINPRNFVQWDNFFDYTPLLADDPKYTIWSDEIGLPQFK